MLAGAVGEAVAVVAGMIPGTDAGDESGMVAGR